MSTRTANSAASNLAAGARRYLVICALMSLIPFACHAQANGKGKIIEYRDGEAQVRDSQLAGQPKPAPSPSAAEQNATASSKANGSLTTAKPTASSTNGPSASSVELIIGGSSKDGSAKVTRLKKEP